MKNEPPKSGTKAIADGAVSGRDSLQVGAKPRFLVPVLLLVLSFAVSAENVVEITSVSVSPGIVRRGANSNCAWATVEVAVRKEQTAPNPTLVLSVFRSTSRPDIPVMIKPGFVRTTLSGPASFDFRVCVTGEIPGTFLIRAAINGIFPETFVVLPDRGVTSPATQTQLVVSEPEPVYAKGYVQVSSVDFYATDIHLDASNGPTCRDATVRVNVYGRTPQHANPTVAITLREYVPSPRLQKVLVAPGGGYSQTQIPSGATGVSVPYRVCASGDAVGEVRLDAAITNVWPASHYDIEPPGPARNGQLSLEVVP